MMNGMMDVDEIGLGGKDRGRILYWASGSVPSWRTMIALHEKGLSYQSRLLELARGDHKTHEVLCLNPRGQVPTFRDGTVVVNESLAIIQYLEDAYPQPALMPKHPETRGLVLQRFHEVTVAQVKLLEAVRVKIFGKGGTEEDEIFRRRLAAAKEELALWDEYLAESDFVAGPDFTIADIAFAPLVIAATRFGATFNSFPNLKRYAAQIKVRPSLAKTWPPHWKTTTNKEWFKDV